MGLSAACGFPVVLAGSRCASVVLEFPVYVLVLRDLVTQDWVSYACRDWAWFLRCAFCRFLADHPPGAPVTADQRYREDDEKIGTRQDV